MYENFYFNPVIKQQNCCNNCNNETYNSKCTLTGQLMHKDAEKKYYNQYFIKEISQA